MIIYNNTVVAGNSNASNPQGANAMEVDASSGLLYAVSSASATLEAVNLASHPLWSVYLSSGAYALATDDADNIVWVAGDSSQIAGVSTTSHQVSGYYSLGGSELDALAVDPALQNLLLVTDESTDRLIAWNTTSHLPFESVPVGVDPTSVTVDPVSGAVIVTDGDTAAVTGNLTILTGTPLKATASVPVGNDPVQATYVPTLGAYAVVNRGSANITLVNATTWKVAGNVNVGTEPNGAAFDVAVGDLDIVNTADSNISVVNPHTAAVVATLNGFFTPYAVSYDSASQQVIVSNHQAENITMLSGATEAVVGNIALGTYLTDVVMDTDNGHLYLANGFPYSSVVVDPVSLQVLQWIPSTGQVPYAAGFDPVLNQIFIANSGLPVNNYAGSISVIDASTNTVIATVPTNPQPLDVQYDADNGNVYAADAGNPADVQAGAVTVFNASTDQIVTTITSRICSYADGLAIDPRNNLIMVGCLGEQPGTGETGVDILSGANNSFVAFIPTGGDTTNEQFNPMNGDIYCTVYGKNSVAVFDPLTLQTVATIPVGYEPADLDVDTDNGYVFVAQNAANSITVINDTNSVVETLTLASSPTAIGFDPVEGAFFSVSQVTGTISEIPVLTVNSFTASPAQLSVKGTTHLVANVPDGAATVSYGYSGLPSGCTTANVSDLACTPTAGGTFVVNVSVTDSFGKHAYALLTLVVNLDPVISKFTVTPDPATVGLPMTLTVTASEGTAPLSYTYGNLPLGCSTSDHPILTCSPSAGGTFDINATVTDADDQNASSVVDLTISPAPVISSFTVSPDPVELDQAATFTVVVQGASTYTYSYANLPPGCSSENTATLTCQPSTTGPYEVTVTVIDAAGARASADTNLTVISPLAITSFSATPSVLSEGTAVTFNAAVVGGTGVDTYAYSGLPSGCASANKTELTCTPSQTGSFEVTFTVTDTHGDKASQSTTITVSSSTFVTELETIGAIVVVLVVVAVVVVWLRRRSGGRAPESPDTETSTELATKPETAIAPESKT